jgi:hypothetical protein
MTPVEQIQEQALKLQAALQAANPQMPILLRQIHTALKADPAIVTLLPEETIQQIVAGLTKQTQVEIASFAMATKKTSIKNLTINDL